MLRIRVYINYAYLFKQRKYYFIKIKKKYVNFWKNNFRGSLEEGATILTWEVNMKVSYLKMLSWYQK